MRNMGDEPADKVKTLSRDIRIKIVGVGGAGIKTASRLQNTRRMQYEYLAIDSDALSVSLAGVPSGILFGTGGQGVNSDMDMAEYYALEKRRDLNYLLRGNDAVIVTCGLGGGTGGAVAPMVLSSAKNFGALAVAIVTYPSMDSEDKTLRNAKKALKKITEIADAYIVIPNDYSNLVGICSEKHKGIILTDKETDASIFAVCALCEGDWGYGAEKGQEVNFSLSGAKWVAASVAGGFLAEETVEKIEGKFTDIPFTNIEPKDIESVCVCVKATNYVLAQMTGEALREIVKARLGNDMPVRLRTALETKDRHGYIIGLIIIKGLRSNPYYPA